jgi:hypothetical protein
MQDNASGPLLGGAIATTLAPALFILAALLSATAAIVPRTRYQAWRTSNRRKSEQLSESRQSPRRHHISRTIAAAASRDGADRTAPGGAPPHVT